MSSRCPAARPADPELASEEEAHLMWDAQIETQDCETRPWWLGVGGVVGGVGLGLFSA
jgi:hypothetical protein